MAYIKAWDRARREQGAFYLRPWHRRKKLTTYIDTRRSKDKLMQKMVDTFGESAFVFCGDMCLPNAVGYNAMRGRMSSPFPGLLKQMQQRFGAGRVCLVDEYNTSKRHHVFPHNETKSLKARDKHGNWRELWSCFLSDRPDQRTTAVIHRDLSASRSIRLLAQASLRGERRPRAYPQNPAYTRLHGLSGAGAAAAAGTAGGGPAEGEGGG
ncbi:hypothetical protein B484DRAFT_468754 [Ochromonadaceae sp. CCMP2298]|nr:hypothetical protein B484DRAFT_468754 [Ochromonadaceae sp. CCMP2298]